MPPVATLEVNGQTQEAGLGSYCWTSAGVNTCYDVAGISTPRDGLVLTDFPANAQIQFKTELAPDKVTMLVMPIKQGQELQGTDDFHRLWKWNSAEMWWGAGLPPKIKIEYPFQEGEIGNEDGLYIIRIDASWQGWGDASYGFLIQIGAGNQQVDITPESITPSQPVSLTTMTPITRLGKGWVSSVALSMDGKLLAVNTSLGVYVYETKTQHEIWFLPLNAYQWRKLDFSLDGKHLAIGWENGGVLVVNTDTGKTLYHITTEESGQPDWSPDGTKLLTGAGCQDVRVWDANNGVLLHTVQEVKCNNIAPDIVRAVWSKNGQYIYVTPGNGYVQAYDVETFQPLTGYTPYPPKYSFGSDIVPSPTENLFALANGLDIAVMDGLTGKIVKLLNGNRQDIPLKEIAWSPDGKQLSSGNSHEVIVWDVNSGQQIYNISEYQPLPGFGWMPDGKTLAGLVSMDGSLHAVDLASNKELFSLDGFGFIGSFSSYPKWDGPELLTYDGTHIVRWDPITGEVISRSLEPQPTDLLPIYGIGSTQVLSPNGRWSVSGTNSGRIVLWDMLTNQPVASLEGHADQVSGLSWSDDSTMLASSSSDGTVLIWKMP
ncbi:MAG: hypothetical protein JNK32_03625 [Anaerolineales bacterium]|nr:hypothetical protein [Anaerolineales bacterium]